jgi:enoyl-CoA hydratase
MEFSSLLYSVEEGIATITVNRPDKLNALNETVIDDLDQAFSAASDDEAVRGVVLTGSGEKSFVAGADIQQFTELDPIKGHRFALRGQEVFNKIEGMTIPVVAAVNGYALGGGCELAMACHLRVASDRAVFGQPEVNLGLIPGYGGTQRLPRLVGRGIALEMMLTGNHVTAQRAYEIGLVNRVASPEDLHQEARKLVTNIAEKSPLAVRYIMEAMHADRLPIEEGLRFEAELFGRACGTEDQKEGARAFLERRKPSFTGR